MTSCDECSSACKTGKAECPFFEKDEVKASLKRFSDAIFDINESLIPNYVWDAVYINPTSWVGSYVEYGTNSSSTSTTNYG
jgi:hypothetical protein